jgi:hypothetical protein
VTTFLRRKTKTKKKYDPKNRDKQDQKKYEKEGNQIKKRKENISSSPLYPALSKNSK